MVTVLVALALIAVFPLVGLLVGLGSDRFWWAVERVVLAVVGLVGIGVIAGEWIASKIRKDRKWNH